jgi:hypothetical protein
MDDVGLFVLLGLLLVVFGLSLGSVIGWFKYRRFGAAVDFGALGIGFLIAGAVALLVLLPTDGPWIIGIAFMGVGAVYLARSRRTPRG